MTAQTNLLSKDGANQDRYIAAFGSGINASPTVIGHTLLTDTGESGIIVNANSAVRVQLLALGVTEISQSNASALKTTSTLAGGTTEVSQSNASALSVHGEFQQLSASALKATAEIYQGAASALNATVVQSVTASGWTIRVVTPSGDTAMSTSLSAVRVTSIGVVDMIQGSGSALNATVAGTVTGNQGTAASVSNAWPIKLVTSSGDPAMNTATSSVRVTGVGINEVQQLTASALNVTALQSANASGWTTRVVTPSGDTAMDTANSALRVNVVVGGGGGGESHQYTASALQVTVNGFVEVRQGLTSALAMHGEVQQLAASALKMTGEVYQAAASALNATVTGTVTATQGTAASVNAPWPIKLVTAGGDLAISGANSAVRVNIVNTAEVQQLSASALKATAEVNQATGSALNATVIQGTAASVTAPWVIKLVTPSGDLAMNTANSTIRVQGYGQLEVQQSNTSALAMHGEVQQLAASALKGTMEIFQAAGSALTMHGEVQQLSASALKATAEIYQAQASALNATVVGNAASGAADSGNPEKIGGHGLATSPTAAATNDRVDAYFDPMGKLFVRTGHQGQNQWTATCVPTLGGGTRAVATIAAGAGNTRNVCTGFVATMIGGSVAPTAGCALLTLLDGTETGNTLFSTWLGVAPTIGMTVGLTQFDTWFKSSQASALTMMFNNAGCANLLQSISFWGTTIVEP